VFFKALREQSSETPGGGVSKTRERQWSINMKVLRKSSLLAPVAFFLATSPNALGAGSAATKGYSGVHGNVQNAVASATATTNGNLPFTGFDLTLMIGGVLLLVLIGAALRRFAGNHA
jgi:hypothetical protein